MMTPMLIARWIASRAFVLVLAVCFCLGAGCSDRRARARIDDSGPPVRGGTLEVVGLSDVDHLATTSAYMNRSIWLARAFARQLVSYAPAPDFPTKTRPVADLALEVPTTENGGISPDGLTYTFRLRRGIRWNSMPPREVSAHDVVRGFKLLCNPVSPAGPIANYTDTIAGLASYCDQFRHVPGTVTAIRDFVSTHDLEGIRAADDFTVVFRLRAPAVDFLNLVAMTFASPVPVEYLDYIVDGPEFRQHTLSCGPYRIARYVQNREILLERNPAWDQSTGPIRRAYVDAVFVRLAIDVQLQQLQIQAGTADLSFGGEVPVAEQASMLETGDTTAWVCPPEGASVGFAYLALNQVGPNNARLLQRLPARRALALAVDKAAVMQVAGGARVAEPARQAAPRGAAGYSEGADQYVTPADRGDAAAARQLLSEAGVTGTVPLRLVYSTSLAWYGLAAQTLQASLRRAGFEVRLIQLTGADLYGRLLADPDAARRGEWDLALVDWTLDWFGENNGRAVVAPLFDGRSFGRNAPNYGGYSNPDVDTLIDRALSAPNLDYARTSWNAAARLVMNDVAIVPLIDAKSVFARSRRVRGCTWSVGGLNCDLTALWLADGERR